MFKTVADEKQRQAERMADRHVSRVTAGEIRDLQSEARGALHDGLAEQAALIERIAGLVERRTSRP